MTLFFGYPTHKMVYQLMRHIKYNNKNNRYLYIIQEGHLEGGTWWKFSQLNFNKKSYDLMI
jgi:hypothetical protein